MKRILLLSLAATALVVLTVPDEVSSSWRQPAQVNYTPPPYYYAPPYYPPPAYVGGYSPAYLQPQMRSYSPPMNRGYSPMYRQPQARSYSSSMYMGGYSPGYMQQPASQMATVGAYDNYFGPRILTVQPGTTVQWVNYGKHNHTVTSNDGLFDSGDMPPGSVYSVTFAGPGIHYYHCHHHMKDRMEGTIIVSFARAYGRTRSYGY